MANGAGYYDFELVNTFEDCSIWLFTNGTAFPVPLVRTPTITFTDLNAPLRGHLARTQDPTEMMVVWNSRNNDDNPQVRWGTTAGGPYPSTAFAESTTYFQDDLCGPPATTQGWFPPHYWNYARINGLVPGSDGIVFYQYGSPSNGWSDEASFKPVPAPGPSQPVHIVTCADMGMTEYECQPGSPTPCPQNHWDEPDASLTTQHMRDRVQGGTGYDYSLLLHPGDLAYATGYELKWELFMSRISSGLGDRVPYMVGQGNHERDWPGTGTTCGGECTTSMDSGGECGIPTQVRFPGATATPHMVEEGWYSFTQGSVFVIMMNTELESGPGSSQYLFFNQTLSAVDRSVTPWVVFLGHRPMYYVDDSKAGGVRDKVYAEFEQLLYDHKVDLALWGHVHNAYASCPMVNSTCVTPSTPGAYDAPVHVSIGNAGQGISPINNATHPDWVLYQAAEWGYATLHAWNETVFTADLYGDDDDGLRYTVTINRAWPRAY